MCISDTDETLTNDVLVLNNWAQMDYYMLCCGISISEVAIFNQEKHSKKHRL